MHTFTGVLGCYTQPSASATFTDDGMLIMPCIEYCKGLTALVYAALQDDTCWCLPDTAGLFLCIIYWC